MNKKLWELYKKSAEGQKLLDLFTLDENCSDNPFKKIEDLLNYLKCCNSDRIKYICCVVNTLRINAHLGNIKLPKINKSLTKTKLNNFFFNYSLWKTEFGNTVNKYTSRRMQSLKYCHLVALLCKVTCACKTCGA